MAINLVKYLAALNRLALNARHLNSFEFIAASPEMARNLCASRNARIILGDNETSGAYIENISRAKVARMLFSHARSFVFGGGAIVSNENICSYNCARRKAVKTLGNVNTSIFARSRDHYDVHYVSFGLLYIGVAYNIGRNFVQLLLNSESAGMNSATPLNFE